MKKLFAFALLLASTLRAADAPSPALSTLRDKEVIATLASIPVQEAGRLKPLDTLARYRLLRFSGKRTISFLNPETKQKETLSALEWMAVTWLRPELSKDMQVFVVDNSEAITQLGLSTENKGKRDRYSYNELLPGRQVLMDKMKEIQDIDAKKRSAVQNMIANLAVNFLDYEMLVTHFDFVAKPFGADLKAVPADVLKGNEGPPVRLSKVLPSLVDYLAKHPESAAPMQNPWLMEVIRGALGGMMSGSQELSLRLFRRRPVPPRPGTAPAGSSWAPSRARRPRRPISPGWPAMKTFT